MQKQIESVGQLYVYDSFNTFYVKYIYAPDVTILQNT